jgi:PAS domain S-box-containing protein
MVKGTHGQPGSTGDGPSGRWVSEDELGLLETSLQEAQETLSAIRNGEVDAIVATGNRIYSLTGAEHPYRVYVEQMQEGAVTVAADGLILYCNQRFADMVGAPLEGVISSVIDSYLSAESWERISAVVVGVESVVKHESILRGRSGEDIAVNFTASKLSLSDQDVICLVVTDLTLQKVDEELRWAKEVAERANLAKDGFLATLSHELRTPLTPALMAVSALQHDPTLSSRVRTDLAMIRRNILLETRLIDDLLDLTRITHNKLDLVETPLDLHGVLRSAVDVCASDIEERKLDLSFDLAATRTNTVGDVVRLQQVFWNVIRNAVKFTPFGGAIHVSTSNPESSQFTVTIADSGIGFDPADSEKLFESFRQVGRDVTRRPGGLGLGLAISRAIVNGHHGRIWGESQGLNRGATIHIQLPLHHSTALASTGEFAPSEPATAGLRILLVEDHEDTRLIFRMILAQKGHSVETAASAGEALTLASQQAFDLVISDLGLPDFSGIELMTILRERYSLRGVAVSGYGMDDDIRRSKSAGFDYHVTKPADPAKIERLLAEVMREIRPSPPNLPAGLSSSA